MFVGVGRLPRHGTSSSRHGANAPCIIFIDEIDAVGTPPRCRGWLRRRHTTSGRHTLNQLLVEMDGFDPSTEGGRPGRGDQPPRRAGPGPVPVPGRFDRQVVVDKPDIQGRKEIFLVHLKGITLEGESEDVADVLRA